MAKPNDKVVSFILILSLLLFITLVESKITIHEGSSPKSEIECSKVVNVKDGDTCFDVSHTFGLGSDEFNAINPNLKCTALFVGQWLCVDGTLF
uniref:LysM domain-containing protein n=1 Tax=Solanum tuberosum TaxID=4113 RepID=M1C1H7_SOLTU